MCPEHWGRVPYDLRNQVLNAYRRNRLSDGYIQLRKRAIAAAQQGQLF